MLLKQITIGSCIESLVYAYLNDNYYLPTLSFGPVFYETLSPAILLEKRKDFTWSRISLAMALSGRLLNYEELNNVRISDDQIKISSSQGFFKYCFEVCNIFDPTGISLENEVVEKKDTMYKVYDDFELSVLGGKHSFLEPKISDDDLAREIHYYTSDRVDGAHYVTDCVVESSLSREQVYDIDYSDSMVRFAVIRHLTSLGIHGNFMTLYKNGSPKYRKPKVTHKKRIVIEKEMNKYKDSEHVKFRSLSLEEIIDGSSS